MTARRGWIVGLVGAWLAVAATLVFFELTSWDVRLQDRFFDFTSGQWCVDREWSRARLMFYDGPKYVLYAAGLGLLGLLVGPQRWRDAIRAHRRDVGVAFLTLLCVPLLIGKLKDVTNVFCPRDLRRYGGDAPYVRAFERYSPDDRPPRRGHCFPAGHASGGFALFGMYWLWRSRIWRRVVILVGLAAGWAMGGYQMLNGAHFLSHTLVTMFAAVIGALALRLVLRERSPAAGIRAQCDS